MDEVQDPGSPLDDVARPRPTPAGPDNSRVTMERSETIVLEVLARSSRDAEARALLEGEEVACWASQSETLGVATGARVQLLCPASDRTVQLVVDAGIGHHISTGDPRDREVRLWRDSSFRAWAATAVAVHLDDDDLPTDRYAIQARVEDAIDNTAHPSRARSSSHEPVIEQLLRYRHLSEMAQALAADPDRALGGDDARVIIFPIRRPEPD